MMSHEEHREVPGDQGGEPQRQGEGSGTTGGGQGGSPLKSAKGPKGSSRLSLENQVVPFPQLETKERNECKEGEWEGNEERELGDA